MRRFVLLILCLSWLAATYGPTAHGATSTTLPTPVTLYRYHPGDIFYHGGPVMQTSTTYAIFWLPPGRHFESAGGSDSRFEGLIEQYFRDVGGTGYYNVLTQYSFAPQRLDSIVDVPYNRLVPDGPITNRSQLGGVVIDRHPYPTSATEQHPLLYRDYLQEVQRVMRSRHWTPSMSDVFFVYTAIDAETCSDDLEQCIFGHAPTCNTGKQECVSHSGCANHASYMEGGKPYILGIMPVISSCFLAAQRHLGYGPGQNPRGDGWAEFSIDETAHEHAEAVTDPLYGQGIVDEGTNAWYSKDPSDYEVADLCESTFHLAGQEFPHGASVRLHGHLYRLQALWSNVGHGCTYGYP